MQEETNDLGRTMFESRFIATAELDVATAELIQGIHESLADSI
jgi:hypothetical protein